MLEAYRPRAASPSRPSESLGDHARMPSSGQITGPDGGIEGTWRIELDDDGSPISE
jgi:hypothetical protein